MASADVPANKIQLEIVTPRGKALTATVDEVTAPSVDGEFGVMPGHVPLLAALRTGLVTYREGSETHKCAVGAGFAEAGANKLLILTDEYIVRDQVDPVIVRKELHEVQAELEKLVVKSEASPRDGEDHKRSLILKENWLAAQLELYGDPPAATMRLFEEYGPPDPFDEEDVPEPSGAAKH